LKLKKSEDLKTYNYPGEATITSNLVSSLEEGFSHSLTVYSIITDLERVLSGCEKLLAPSSILSKRLVLP